MADAQTEVLKEFNLPATTAGVVVWEVKPDSVANDAGLRRGDVIESVDGQPVKNLREFSASFRGKKLSEGVPIRYLRENNLVDTVLKTVK